MLGLGVGGKLQVLVEGSGELVFAWSLSGQRDADDVLNFQFDLPACPANRLILDLPAEMTPVADEGLVSQVDWTGERLRRWEIELGGHNRFRLRVLRTDVSQRQRQLPLVRGSVEYHFSERGLDVLAELKLEIHNAVPPAAGDAVPSQVTLVLDRELQLVTASYGDASLPWSVTSANGNRATRVVLTLPEKVRGTEGVLQLRALARLVKDRRWRLPRIRPEGVFWQEGTATLLIPGPLLLKRLVPIRCRQTATGPLPGTRGGESVQLQYFTPDATTEIILSQRSAPVELVSGTAIELGERGMTAEVQAVFTIADGSRFSLEADVLRWWLIDSVESDPPEAVDDWDAGKPSGRRRELSVRLAKSLSPARPIRLVIRARRLRSPLQRKLGVADLVPLRFRTPQQSKRLVAVRAAGPYELRLTGNEELNRIDASTLDSAQRELFAELPDELLFENDPAAAELRISLESRNLNETVQTAPPPQIVSHSGDPTTPPAWAWDCRLESRYEANGTGRHLAVYRLQSSRREALKLDLPAGVKPENVHGVWVNGQDVGLQGVTGAAEGRLTIDLPRGEEFPAVSILYTTPAARLGTIGSRIAPFPEVDLKVLARRWTVWLPPGYEAFDADPGWEQLPERQLSLSQRLFGPLGRPAGQPALDPLAAMVRLRGPGGPGDASTIPVETLPGQPAELKGPWSQAILAGGQPVDSHGWNRYDLRISAKSGVRLKFVHRQTMRLVASITFLLVIALGWWTAGVRLEVFGFLAGGFGCAALLLPEAYVPLASGALLGTLFCLAYRLIRGPHAKGEPRADSTAQRDLPRTFPGATPLGVLVFVSVLAGGVCSAAHARQPEQRATSPAPPVHRVFIPIDQEQEPTGGKYYVPRELYVQLHRRGSEATEEPQGWLIKTATYRGTLARETTSQRLAVEELKASFALVVFDSAARVRIPLGRQHANLLPDGALLDSRVIRPEWEADGSALLLEVPQPGEYRLELSLRPTLRSDGATAGFDLSVPRLPSSRLELNVPQGASAIRVPSAVGMIRFDDARQRMVAELGPSGRLTVSWPDGAGRGAAGSVPDVEELLWMKVQPGSVVVDARLKFKIAQGQVRQVRLATDPRLRLLPLEGDDPPAVEVTKVPGQPQIVVLRWPAPISEGVVLSARFILTGTSGVGNLRLPLVKALGARSTRRWLAVSVDPALEHEEQAPERLEAAAVPDFLGSWGHSESQPLFAYRLPPGETDWSISTQLCEPRTKVDQKLALSFDRGSVAVRFDADLVPEAGYIFQHRLLGPAGLRIEDVSVLEEGARRSAAGSGGRSAAGSGGRSAAGSGGRCARWSQDENGAITVFLTELMAGPQKLSLRGRMPARGGKLALPVLRIDRGELQSSTIDLFRRPAVLVELGLAEGLLEVDDPAINSSDAELGRLVGRFRVESEQPVKATLGLTQNRPQVRAEQVTWLRPSGGLWKAQIDCRLHVSGGVVDEIRIEAPSPLSEPYRVSPPAGLEMIDTPDQGRQLIVRPAAAIHGDYQFSISAQLALMPGDPPSTPEVLVRRVDQLRRFVALPKQADGQPVQWKRQGLEEAQLPEGFATPPDAEAFVIYEAGQPGRATLSRSHARENPRVRLADVQVAWQADGSCVGVARFDLEPGRSSECELWLPTGYSLLRVSLSGVPTEPVPTEPPSSHVRAWRLSLDRAGLGSAGLPQQIEVLFNGKPTDPARAAGRTFQTPTLGRLAVEQTLWTVVGPSPLEPGRPEDRSLVAPWSHELSRLKSAAGLIESASTVPLEDAEETLRWYRRWAGRLAAARTALQNSSAPNGPTSSALEEIAAIDAKQLQIARRLGVSEVYRRLKQEGVSPAGAPAELWRRSLQQGQARSRCAIPGRSGSITLSYRRARTTGLPYRLAGATGLVALIVLVVLGLRRGTLAEWFNRWPQAIGVVAGLAWWLWLSPSILGWAIVLVSLVAALLSGWKYSPPAPGSSVISLRARQLHD